LVEQRVVDVLLQNHCSLSRAVLTDHRLNAGQLLLYLDACSSVSVFSRLDDPDIAATLGISELLLFVVLLELDEFWVVLPHLDVEGQRESVEHVLLPFTTVSVVVPHIDE